MRRWARSSCGRRASGCGRCITNARNGAAARLLERVGMRREGHSLQNVWFKGAWGDEFSFAILQDGWVAQSRGLSGNVDPNDWWTAIPDLIPRIERILALDNKATEQ